MHIIYIVTLSPVRKNRAFFMLNFMKQLYNKYTKQDHLVWECLFERQVNNLPNKVAKEYLDCLENLQPNLNKTYIPNFNKLDVGLSKFEGWIIEVVPGLIPVDDFFSLLANKKFCSSTWLRKMDQLDYLEEPDMFHDIFGHIPLLAHKPYADFVAEFGKIGFAHAENEEIVKQLQRLYWFTIEFGLIRQEEELKIYGAGIISSFSETNSIFQTKAIIKPFDLKEIIETDFETDKLQECYFVIESFEQLYDSLKEYKMMLKNQTVLKD